MIWIIFAALSAATLAVLLVPLLRARPKTASRAQYDLTVYKDQLAEVEREVERGTLSADHAEAARTEIQRRILAAGERKDAKASPRSVRLAAIIVAVAVPAVGFGVYGMLGQPNLPDLPHASRPDPSAQMQNQDVMIRGMVAQLQARLEKAPNDAKGWAMLGRSLRVLGQADKAKEAYRKSAALNPGDVQVRMELGGMILADVPPGAPLPGDFVGLMREVLAVSPNSPDALYFLGMSAAQTGDKAKARQYWTRLLPLLPEGSDDKAEIQKQLDGLK